MFVLTVYHIEAIEVCANSKSKERFLPCSHSSEDIFGIFQILRIF